MATPPPQTKHYAINQFLSEVLSQRGPSSLPYAEDTKWLIRQHLLTLTSAYPSLDPKTATFTHNDGRTVNLLQADGTVPMAYQSVTYNIPIIIWLIDSYPRHPPLVYVNPTRDMVISSSHPHVNPSGLVSIPYLQNWIYPTSNLVDLARELSHMFSRNPPVYTKSRSNPNPTPNPNPPVPIYHHNHPNPSSFGSAGAYPPRPMVRPPYSPSPYGGAAAAGSTVSSGVTGGGRVGTDDAAEVYRKNAIGKVIDMVHRDVVELRKAREGEMEGLFAAQGALKRREEEINMGLKEMRDEVEALETQLQVVLMNTDVLEGWVRLNESKVKGNVKDMDVDSAFECTDVLSKQMLDSTSVDLAIEDVIYSLDKAVQEGAVPFDQYLKNVRLLSREQFFKRALAAKVRAAQMQSQVANMAARAPHYAA